MPAGKNAYNAGIMQKSGAAFAAEFFAEKNKVVHESNTVVLVLMKSDEIDAIVEEMILGPGKKENPSITVEDRTGFWWIKADGQSVRVEVGPIFQRDEAQRRHDLPLKRLGG